MSNDPPTEELAGCVSLWYVPPYVGSVIGEPNESVFIAESAVIELLNAEVLFVNCRQWLDLDGATKRPPTLVLFLTGEDEPNTVSYSQLRGLYDAWKATGSEGVDKWKAARRTTPPPPPSSERTTGADYAVDPVDGAQHSTSTRALGSSYSFTVNGSQPLSMTKEP